MIENPNHPPAAEPPKKKPRPMAVSRAKRIAAQKTLKTKRAAHRPSSINPAIVNQIVTLLQNGIAVEVTSAAVGINVSTFYNWMKRGEASNEGIYKDFYEGVSRAYAICEINMVKTVQKHAETDPSTARWMLGVRFPDRWGQVQKHAILQRTEVTSVEALPQSTAPVIIVNMPGIIDQPRVRPALNPPKALEINPASGTIGSSEAE